MSVLKVRMIKTPESTSIESFGYEENGRRLFIRFRGGWVYSFNGVPQTLLSDLHAAPSKGDFFANFIKNVYSYVEIRGSADVVFIDSEDGEAFFQPNLILQGEVDTRWAW